MCILHKQLIQYFVIYLHNFISSKQTKLRQNMDSQAIALNKTIENENGAVLNMLSQKGQEIFFPKQGILAQAGAARGKEINATIGEAKEDDGSSMHLPILKSMINIDTDLVFPYAPSFGKPEIRNAWKEFIYKKNPSLGKSEISSPIATNGLTHGLSIAGYLFANNGESVLLSNLYWENYDLIFTNGYGAGIKTFNLFADKKFDIHSFSTEINNTTEEKIILLLNFPNNPTGYTPLESEMPEIINEIKGVAEKGKKIVVLIDDAYFGLVFEDGVYSESIFSQLAQLHENVLAVKLDGPTKEDYVWGFRVGFITFGIKNGTPKLYEALEAKTAGAIRGNISNISNISQSMLYKAYVSGSYEEEKKEKFEKLKSRCQTLRKELSKKEYDEYFEALPFNSGYFMCVQLKKGLDPEKVRIHLLEKYSTGVIVLNNVIRLAFSAVPQNKLAALAENLYKACKDLS